VDEATDTLVLDYWVNDATKQAFRESFDGSALALFQAFQVLLTLKPVCRERCAQGRSVSFYQPLRQRNGADASVRPAHHAFQVRALY
jgi:hypothetical protein